ncbi:hypothetical protein KU6B_01070 [Mameliella alba]|uniref:hypothetical protein n=1 Tax=Mameliella alba TaxID=561184 RepID=UPI0013E44090|nr:hypothetical protein [Mameliella alba]BBU53842.1 hypothetical protein KU6B_01070 [Mameliella alba]
MTRFVALGAFALAVGCSAPAENNPGLTSMTIKNGTVKGTYNPSGWTSQEIRKDINAGACAGRGVASYAEVAQPNGLISYTATCA